MARARSDKGGRAVVGVAATRRGSRRRRRPSGPTRRGGCGGVGHESHDRVGVAGVFLVLCKCAQCGLAGSGPGFLRRATPCIAPAPPGPIRRRDSSICTGFSQFFSSRVAKLSHLCNALMATYSRQLLSRHKTTATYGGQELCCNQPVGCRTNSFLGDDDAVLASRHRAMRNRHRHAIAQASPLVVAATAWTRRGGRRESRDDSESAVKF